MGSSHFLPRLAGASVAAEFLDSGRFIDAQRACRSHLVSAILPPEELPAQGRSLAEDMRQTAPRGLRLFKDVLIRNIDAPGFDAARALEDRQRVMLTMTQDHGEAIGAFFSRRAPHDADR